MHFRLIMRLGPRYAMLVRPKSNPLPVFPSKQAVGDTYLLHIHGDLVTGTPYPSINVPPLCKQCDSDSDSSSGVSPRNILSLEEDIPPSHRLCHFIS